MKRTTRQERPAPDAKIQLRHPKGKNAVRISKDKYTLVRASLVRVLKSSGKASFIELQRGVRADLRSRGVVFLGSLPWYLEWVRLDQEARGVVVRDPKASPRQFRLAGKR